MRCRGCWRSAADSEVRAPRILGPAALLSAISRQQGPMVEPVQSAAFFADMDIDDDVLTWPNDYDLDPVTVRHWAEQGFCA